MLLELVCLELAVYETACGRRRVRGLFASETRVRNQRLRSAAARGFETDTGGDWR
jgi:hypothetical protein